MLQALPLPEGSVSSKPLLRADNVAVVLLWEQRIECPVFDGNRIRGPVPVLFSDNPEECRMSVEEAGDHFISEIVKMNCR